MRRVFLDDLPGELASASQNTGAQQGRLSVTRLTKTGGACFFDRDMVYCMI